MNRVKTQRDANCSALRRVLIAIDDSALASALQDKAEACGSVVMRSSAQDGVAQADQYPFEAIVSLWSDDWQKWLTGRATAPAFAHFGLPSDSLLKEVARGLHIFACKHVDEVSNVVKRLGRPVRVSSRRSVCAGKPARVEFAEWTIPAEMLDYSSEGLAFLIPFGSPLRRVMPGAILQGLKVSVDGQVMLDGVDARVMSVCPMAKGYRVGCHLARFTPQVPFQRELVEDPTRIGALILAAVRRSGICLLQRGETTVTHRMVDGAVVDWVKREISAALDIGPMSAPGIVSGQFELGHMNYEFSTVVLDASPLRLQLPHSLGAHNRRLTLRRTCTLEVTLAATHPLTGLPMTLQVGDLSAGGMSFRVSDVDSPFPVGLRLPAVSLELPGYRPLRAHAVVRSAIRVSPELVRCGAELVFDSADDKLRYADSLVHNEFALAQSGNDVAFDSLFSFLEQVRAAPEGMDREIVQPVFEKLQQAPDSLARALIAKHSNEVVAHVGAVRRYTNTWTLQHVSSAARDGRTALALCRAQIEFCQNQPTGQFVHSNYALSNAFSSRVIGSALSGIACAERWALRQRVIGMIEGGHAPETAAAIDVRPAVSDADFVAGESIICQWEPAFLLVANDWQAPFLAMRQLQAEYLQFGLTRARHLLVAECEGVAVGFAVAELSAIGLNLREDFSAARIWVSRDAKTIADAVERALLGAVEMFYKSEGRTAWPLIANPEQSGLVEAMRPQHSVRFIEATARRDSIAELSDIWAQMSRGSSRPSNAASAA